MRRQSNYSNRIEQNRVSFEIILIFVPQNSDENNSFLFLVLLNNKKKNKRIQPPEKKYYNDTLFLFKRPLLLQIFLWINSVS